MNNPKACGRLGQLLVRMVEACSPNLYKPSTPIDSSPVHAYGQVPFSNLEGHSYFSFITHLKIMLFRSFQQSSWKDGYVLGHQSDYGGSEVFEKSGASLPKRRSNISRLLLICTILTTCYSVLITAALTRYTVRSKYAGPNIIYSKFRENTQTMPG